MSVTCDKTLLDVVHEHFPDVRLCNSLPKPPQPWDPNATPLDENSPTTPALESQLAIHLPQEGYTLTPLRGGDEEHEDLTRIMNHPLVYPTLRSPPVPYSMDHAMVWCTLVRRQQLSILAALASRADSVPPAQCPGFSPLGAIRYEGKLIGTCVLHGQAADTPFAEQTWEIGYSLHPDHAGKGVMYAALKAHMDFLRAVRKALALPPQLPSSDKPRPLFFGAAMEYNHASQRVMQKAGLKLVRKVRDPAGSTYGSRGAELVKPGEQQAMGILPPHIAGQDVWDVELESLE